MNPMRSHTLCERMTNWGYIVEQRANEQGHMEYELLVALRQKPTLQHFDPESIQARSFDAQNNTGVVSLRWETPLSGPHTISAGLITLRDRFDKRVGFYAYGGMLEAVVGTNEVIYVLSSPAPMLELYSNGRMEWENQLAAETRALFARCRVNWEGDDFAFQQALQRFSPLELYATIIFSLMNRYECEQRLHAGFPMFVDKIRQESHRLSKQSFDTATSRNLEDLLAP